MGATPTVKRFLRTVVEHALVEIVALYVPGGEVLAIAQRSLGAGIAKSIFPWFAGNTIDERQRVLDDLAALPPDEASAIVEEWLAEHPEAGTEETRKLALHYCEAIPSAVRKATTRPDDGGVTHTRPEEIPRSPQALERLLPVRPPALRVGNVVPGDLELEALLGQGGFGEVWRARGRHFDDQVFALKFCLDESLKAALRHEVKINKVVRGAGGSPYVVRVEQTNLGFEPPFLVLEYMPGGDLRTWARQYEGAMVPSSVVVDVMGQVAKGLAFIHRAGLVHRDLKPENILVAEDSTFKLADLGIGAALKSEDTPTALTAHTMILSAASPAYRDPSSDLSDPSPVDDIYALGMIALQLLFGDLQRQPPLTWAGDLTEAGISESLISLLIACVGRAERRPANGDALSQAIEALPASTFERSGNDANLAVQQAVAPSSPPAPDPAPKRKQPGPWEQPAAPSSYLYDEGMMGEVLYGNNDTVTDQPRVAGALSVSEKGALSQAINGLQDNIDGNFFYPVLRRALIALPDGSGPHRRALYGKARQALLKQLQTFDPPLPSSEVTGQRLALEDAIRLIENQLSRPR